MDIGSELAIMHAMGLLLSPPLTLFLTSGIGCALDKGIEYRGGSQISFSGWLACLNLFDQLNITGAFEIGGCKVVRDMSSTVRTAIESEAIFVQADDAGKSINSLHPNAKANQLCVTRNTPDQCEAIASAVH